VPCSSSGRTPQSPDKSTMKHSHLPRRTVSALCLGFVLSVSASLGGAVQFPGQRDAEAAQFHFRVGQVALRNGDLTVAAREFEEAARLAPSNALAWYNLGVVESRRNNPQKTIDSFRRALQLGLPATEKNAAEEAVAVATYEIEKVGADKKEILYGLAFGLSLEQVRRRGIRLGNREASEFGARYGFQPQEDTFGGEEEQASLYFGEQGLQRIWVSFGSQGVTSYSDELESLLRQITGVLQSRGFRETDRRFPPREFRSGNSRLPLQVRFANAALIAILHLDFEQCGTEVTCVTDFRLWLYDSALCPRCGR